LVRLVHFFKINNLWCNNLRGLGRYKLLQVVTPTNGKKFPRSQPERK